MAKQVFPKKLKNFLEVKLFFTANILQTKFGESLLQNNLELYRSFGQTKITVTMSQIYSKLVYSDPKAYIKTTYITTLYVLVANLFPEVSNLQFATQYKHLYSKALQDLLFKICKVGQCTCIIV